MEKFISYNFSHYIKKVIFKKTNIVVQIFSSIY